MFISRACLWIAPNLKKPTARSRTSSTALSSSAKRFQDSKAYGRDVAEAEAALAEVEQALQDLSDYRDLLYSRISE